MPYENSDDAERYSDHEERERTEDPEREEPDEDMEKEAAENQERREAADRLANEVSDELDEMESKDSGENDFEKNDFNNDLGHDLDEVRDDLHDRYVNDMERQLEGASTKEVEGDETDSDGSASEMTESSESYHDAGDSMAYAMRTKGASGEAEAAETETEEETQEVSEPEAQEPTEQQAESEETEEPVNEKGTNQIPRYESEEGETATSYESQETHEYNDARTSPEASEPENEAQEVSEDHAEAEPALSNEDQHDTSELSEPVEEGQQEGELSETSESDVETDDLEQEIDEILESIEESHEVDEAGEETVDHDESGQELSEDPERKHEVTTSGHESPEQEMSEEPEVESEEAQEHEIPAEDEPLPEDVEDFVKRVKEILDEKMDSDEDYDLVQDPLTGEMQRVPKILGEYESDEQKQRRKRRNLFAELSEEERERFKEIVREDAENDEERSAEDVERAWNKVVAKAEQEREELLQRVKEVLEDPDVMQLLEGWSKEDKRLTNVESTEDDEVDEDSPEHYLTKGKLRIWIPEVNGEKIESIEQLEEIVRERFPGLLKHNDYSKYIRQARLHLELVERFQSEDLQRGDIARISKETGSTPTIIKRWLKEGAKPRVYHYLTRNPLDDREDRVAGLLASLNSITDMKTLEQRLRTLFFYEVLEGSKNHARDLERARLFFQFLDEYAKGGILKSIAKRLGIGKSTISEWFKGSQLPSYVRMAAEIPSEQPKSGKKWLPLRLNSRTNLPEQFIQVPETVTSEEDLLFVLRQLQSLHTPEMKEFEEKYGREPKHLAFLYLLGLIVSDGGFDADTELSARVVLSASKKYRWSLRLGRAFSYTMGRIGMNVERRADNTRVRDGKTIVCNVWGSQASPLLRWVKEVLLGLGPSYSKKQTSIDAEWILRMPHDYGIAFLQGLADGDGYASIKTNHVGIASKPNRGFIRQLLSSLDIHSNLKKTKVVINRHDDILRANSFPFFRHATSRKKNHDELCKIIRLFKRDRASKKVPENEMTLIRELHESGLTPGEITERLWFEHRLPRTISSVFKIVKRIMKKKGESES